MLEKISKLECLSGELKDAKEFLQIYKNEFSGLPNRVQSLEIELQKARARLETLPTTIETYNFRIRGLELTIKKQISSVKIYKEIERTRSRIKKFEKTLEV